MPRLVPQGVDRAWGQIVLAKAETLDVQAAGEPKGLRPIDPQHDIRPAGRRRRRGLRVPRRLGAAGHRHPYQLEKIKRTSIDRAVVRMVVTPAGEISVQALYRVESARQRLGITLPDEATFDTEPLRVDGRPVPLERGKLGEYFVPVLTANADEPFLLELRYTVKGDGSRLNCPSSPTRPPCRRSTSASTCRPRRRCCGSSGPWNEEFQWRLARACSGNPGTTGAAETSDDKTLLVALVRREPAAPTAPPPVVPARRPPLRLFRIAAGAPTARSAST